MMKGLDWGNPEEVSVLQKKIKSMKDKCIKLVDVIDIMLQCRILPLELQGGRCEPTSPRTCQQCDISSAPTCPGCGWRSSSRPTMSSLWKGRMIEAGVSRYFDEVITMDLVETTLTIRLQTCTTLRLSNR